MLAEDRRKSVDRPKGYAMKPERKLFFEVWDRLDVDDREYLYKHLQDEPKEWLERRAVSEQCEQEAKEAGYESYSDMLDDLPI